MLQSQALCTRWPPQANTPGSDEGNGQTFPLDLHHHEPHRQHRKAGLSEHLKCHSGPRRRVETSSDIPLRHLPAWYPVPEGESSTKREQQKEGHAEPVSEPLSVETRQRMEDITMDIPHPHSYPMPRGKPGLHDIYAGDEAKRTEHKNRPAASRCKRRKGRWNRNKR